MFCFSSVAIFYTISEPHTLLTIKNADETHRTTLNATGKVFYLGVRTFSEYLIRIMHSEITFMFAL
jgi:hypothetical protein